MIGMALSPSWGNIPTPSRFLKVYKRIQVPLRSPKVLRATFSVAPQHGLPHGEVEFDDVVKHYRTPLGVQQLLRDSRVVFANGAREVKFQQSS